MAHYAELDESNVVTQVVVVCNEELLENGVECEHKGLMFLQSLFGHSRWRQTSFNGSMRWHYAGIGYTYRVDLDAFIPPCPGEGWTLDESTGVWIEAAVM